MKKITLFLTLLAMVAVTQAQDYESLKQYMLLGQYKKAKEELDKKWTNAKFVSKPEAYILKANIYGALAADSAVRFTPQGEQLQTDAEAAFAKYREMDPKMELAKNPEYKNGPINIYSNLFSLGYKDYENKNWAPAAAKFKRVAELSDILEGMGVLTSKLDTNVMVLAAYTAENSGNKDEAEKYYARLADAKVTGEGFEGVYRFLVTHNFEKKDMAAFEKYKAIGHELFPKSEFFTYDKVDFAAGLEDNFDAKIKSLEQVVANDPTNYKANLSIGQLIYDTLYNSKQGAVKPANATELEGKMVTALRRAAEAKPESELAFLYLGDHFINKSIQADDARTTHAADMKKRTKPGSQPSKDDVAKREQLDKEYGETLDNALTPYEKAAEILGKKASLTGQEKQQYKKVSGYLGDIYTYKKGQAKGKPADVAKFTELEKKWNDVYAGIK